MKILLLLWVTLTTLFGVNMIENYCNSKFSFSIDYPSDVFVNKIYEDKNSIKLSNKKNSVRLWVGGSTIALFMSANNVYMDEICLTSQRGTYDNESIKITYKSQKDNGYVISGYNDTKKTIFYTKGLVYRKNGENVLIEYTFTYPIKEKKKYEKLIKIFNKSFSYEVDSNRGEKDKVNLKCSENKRITEFSVRKKSINLTSFLEKKFQNYKVFKKKLADLNHDSVLDYIVILESKKRGKPHAELDDAYGRKVVFVTKNKNPISGFKVLSENDYAVGCSTCGGSIIGEPFASKETISLLRSCMELA